jgi:hypothetical protein
MTQPYVTIVFDDGIPKTYGPGDHKLNPPVAVREFRLGPHTNVKTSTTQYVKGPEMNNPTDSMIGGISDGQWLDPNGNIGRNYYIGIVVSSATPYQLTPTQTPPHQPVPYEIPEHQPPTPYQQPIQYQPPTKPTEAIPTKEGFTNTSSTAWVWIAIILAIALVVMIILYYNKGKTPKISTSAYV